MTTPPLAQRIKVALHTAAVGRSVKPLLVLGNDGTYAQRTVLAGAAEHQRRLVRFDHPLAPAARGALWLVAREMVPSVGSKPNTLAAAFPAAGVMAKSTGRPLLCLAPALDQWSSKDLRDLAHGLYACTNRSLPVVFVGFAGPRFATQMQEGYIFSDTLFDTTVFIRDTVP